MNNIRDKMLSYSKQGFQLAQQGNIYEAEKCYLAQYELAKKLLQESNSRVAIVDYICSCSSMVSVSRFLGHLEDAEAYNAEEMEFAEKLYGMAGSVPVQRMLGVAYEHRGCILADMDELSES